MSTSIIRANIWASTMRPAHSRVVGPSMAGLGFSSLTVNAPFLLAGLTVTPAIALAWSARRRRGQVYAGDKADAPVASFAGETID
jgi:hypothetical protein